MELPVVIHYKDIPAAIHQLGHTATSDDVVTFPDKMR